MKPAYAGDSWTAVLYRPEGGKVSREMLERWSARKEVVVRVKDIMSAPVTTVAAGDSLHTAHEIMNLGGLRHLPVVDGRGLVGMLTKRDILSAPGLFAPVLLAVDTRATLKVHRVDEAMSGLVTIGAQGSLQEAAEKLLKHRVDCLSVLEEWNPSRDRHHLRPAARPRRSSKRSARSKMDRGQGAGVAQRELRRVVTPIWCSSLGPRSRRPGRRVKEV